MILRPQSQRTPKGLIPQGTIVAKGIYNYFDAESVKANFEHEDKKGNNTGIYNISGVAGDYRIVKYLNNPETAFLSPETALNFEPGVLFKTN